MTNDKQLGLAGTVAGLGLAIGGLAFGAFLSQRRKGGGSATIRRNQTKRPKASSYATLP